MKMLFFLDIEGHDVAVMTEQITHLQWGLPTEGEKRLPTTTINFVGGGFAHVMGHIEEVARVVIQRNKQ